MPTYLTTYLQPDGSIAGPLDSNLVAHDAAIDATEHVAWPVVNAERAIDGLPYDGASIVLTDSEGRSAHVVRVESPR